MKGLDKTFIDLDKRLERGVSHSDRRKILIDMALIVKIRQIANNTTRLVFDENGMHTEPLPFKTEEQE